MGGYEPDPISWTTDDVPQDWEFKLFDDDFDHFEQHMEQAIARVPALAQVGVKKMINGPESFTPDGNFILGRANECENMFVGAGFNAFGIAAGGGAGWVLAEWAMKGEAPLDLWVVDIRRFSSIHKDRDFVNRRTLEAYGKHYTVAFPHEEQESGRPLLVSPLYGRLQRYGAVFGSKLGWERANWFARGTEPKRDVYAMGRQNWFAAVGDEHAHVRTHVGVFDQTSFAKFMVRGKDAGEALEWLCANRVARGVGRLTYTQLLNSRGGIEADLTVSRLVDDMFYVVTGSGFRAHDFGWIREHLPKDRDVRIEDVTEDFGTLSLMGPKARDVLAMATASDVSASAFPFGAVRQLEIAGHAVWALRVTYVGELGWELHMPMVAVADVFDCLIGMGAAHHIRPIGYRALESLRLEKTYRAWGADITPNDTPFEAGLGWAVKLRSGLPFLGRDALEKVAFAPLRKSLVGFAVEDKDAVLVGRETILRNGEAVGYLTSGGFGYTVGQPIGIGYVRQPEGVTADYLLSGHFDLVIANEVKPAKLSLEPFVDPANLRVKS
jgi:sarcosine dehydrogenase